LTNDQLSNKQLLPLDILNNRLSEIIQHESIDMVDLYGGELGLLPYDYWNDLITLLQSYGIDDINLITNLSMINDITTDKRVYTSVSFDFDAREQSDRVLKNMALLNKPFSILMLASPKLVTKNVDEMVNILNTLSNLVSVEIKPYSSNQANQLNVTYHDYEDFVKQWIVNTNKKFNLTNENLINTVLDGTRNSFSDDHIYITPTGNYGVLEFDLNDNEFFLEYDSIEKYYDWCLSEKKRVLKNKYCNSCEYYGKCLSEHLREVTSIDNGCNGFYDLIKWYDSQ
jgi:hypothetical protein